MDNKGISFLTGRVNDLKDRIWEDDPVAIRVFENDALWFIQVTPFEYRRIDARAEYSLRYLTIEWKEPVTITFDKSLWTLENSFLWVKNQVESTGVFVFITLKIKKRFEREIDYYWPDAELMLLHNKNFTSESVEHRIKERLIEDNDGEFVKGYGFSGFGREA